MWHWPLPQAQLPARTQGTTATHFAAESSTGANVNVRTIDDFTKSVDALVYYIDPDNEEMKIAYPNLLFDHNNRWPHHDVLLLDLGHLYSVCRI